MVGSGKKNMSCNKLAGYVGVFELEAGVVVGGRVCGVEVNGSHKQRPRAESEDKS